MQIEDKMANVDQRRDDKTRTEDETARRRLKTRRQDTDRRPDGRMWSKKTRRQDRDRRRDSRIKIEDETAKRWSPGKGQTYRLYQGDSFPTVRAVLGYLTASPCRQPALSSAPRLSLNIPVLHLSCCLRQFLSESSSLLSTSIYIGFLVALATLCCAAAQ